MHLYGETQKECAHIAMTEQQVQLLIAAQNLQTALFHFLRKSIRICKNDFKGWNRGRGGSARNIETGDIPGNYAERIVECYFPAIANKYRASLLITSDTYTHDNSGQSIYHFPGGYGVPEKRENCGDSSTGQYF